MPVYIKENPEFLALSLQSLLEQSTQPAEILLVEDGPLTPELKIVIERYAVMHPEKFSVIKLEVNQGMGAAMDYGLRHCKHEYVARMDSDDIARYDRFEKQVSFLQANPEIDVLGSYIEEFSTTPGDLNRFRKVPLLHNDIEDFAKRRNPINHMTAFMKKSAALNVGGYWHKRVLEDYNLWYKMIRQGYKFQNYPEALVYARVGNNMVGRRRGLRYIKQEISFYRTMLHDHFITGKEFYLYSFVRIILKLLPSRFLNFIYSKLLRH